MSAFGPTGIPANRQSTPSAGRIIRTKRTRNRMAATESLNHFQFLDYAIFAVYLLASVLIGVVLFIAVWAYFAPAARRARATVAAFLFVVILGVVFPW